MATFTDPLIGLMPDTITYAGWQGMSTDGYATPSYTTAVSSYACRIGSEQRLVRNFDGIEELATTTVWVASTSTFSALGEFTLPDGEAPGLLSIETYRDEYGITHSKLGFGS
jgi:hypothetical protein